MSKTRLIEARLKATSRVQYLVAITHAQTHAWLACHYAPICIPPTPLGPK